MYKKLNIIHEEKNNKKYWSILIDPWLMYFVQNFYHKWLTIENIHKNYKNLKMNRYSLRKKFKIPNDFNDYFQMMQNNELNAFIFSNISFKFFNNTIKKNRDLTIDIKNNEKIRVNKKFKEIIIKKIINFICFKKINIFLDSYVGLLEIIKFCLKKKLYLFFLILMRI